MFEKVKNILLEYVDKSNEISLDSKLTSDLGLNSYEVVNVVVRFEEEFDMEIPDRDLQKLVTVRDIVDYIENNG